MEIGDYILRMKLKHEMIKGISEFYKEVLEVWKALLPNVCFKLERKDDFLNQPLFLNENILYKGKELYFKIWIQAGFKKVRCFIRSERSIFAYTSNN